VATLVNHYGLKFKVKQGGIYTLEFAIEALLLVLKNHMIFLLILKNMLSIQH